MRSDCATAHGGDVVVGCEWMVAVRKDPGQQTKNDVS